MMGRHRGRTTPSYGIALGVALALILVARAAFGGSGADRADCTSITVVSSSEKAGLLADIARSYGDAHRSVSGGCGSVQVVAMSSGDAASTLVAGWDEAVRRPAARGVDAGHEQLARDRGRAPVERRPAAADPGHGGSRGLRPARDRDATTDGGGDGLADPPDRVAGSVRADAGPRRMGPVRTPGVGSVQARQDQPELLDVGSERADRRVLRRHRDLQRPDRGRDP